MKCPDCGSEGKCEVGCPCPDCYAGKVNTSGHFTVKKTYRGTGHTGIPASASEVGNQPEGKQVITIEGSEEESDMF